MRHIAAYLLLQIGGNASPSAADVKKVLSAVGIEAEDDRLEKLISELEGKDVNAVCFLFPFSKLTLDAEQIFFSALYSSLLRALLSSPPFPRAVLLLPPLVLLLVVLPPLLPRRKRRRRRKRRFVLF